MSSKVVIFLSSILVFYFGIHLLFYFSTIYFFSIDSQEAKYVLMVVFGILSLSFIISAIFSRGSNAWLVKIYYTLSAFWVGWAVYLLIGAILAWLLNFIFSYFGLDIKVLLGILTIIFSLAVCFYGLFQSDHPQIKNISVNIKNLPASWQGKKVIHLSDLHLGDINGKSFARDIVGKVNKLNPEAIFISGDLFDGTDGVHESFIDILEDLSAKRGIYFVTGNHETYLGSKEIIRSLRQSKIRVLDNEFIEVDGLQVVGLSYPEASQQVSQDRVLENLVNYQVDLPTILLYHEPVSIHQKSDNFTSQQVNSYWRPNTDFSAQKKSGINLQLSGHTHQGQFFPFNLLTKYIYNGYDYGLSTDGDFNLYVTSGTGTWGPPFRIGTKSEIVVIELN